MTRLDRILSEERQKGEGILSVSLPPTGGKWTWEEYYKIVDMIVAAGTNQFLQIMADPRVFKNNGAATAEVLVAKDGFAKGDDLEPLFPRLVRTLKDKYPNLGLVASNLALNDTIAYGMGRYLDKCVEVGIDAIDIPTYQIIKDELGFYKRMKKRGLHNICAIHADSYDLNNPEHLALIEKLCEIGSGEIFLVPAIPMTENGFDGKVFKPYVDMIRDFLKKHDHEDCKIISIGGIATPEDAHQLVTIAGTDGVHFSSRFIKQLLADKPLEEIYEFLKSVKDAMRN